MLPPLLGTALLLLLFVDVFRTVFLPQGHGGPVSRLLYWGVWRALCFVGKREGAGKDRWLRLGGPALALLTPVVWASILVVGYALVFYPWIGTFRASPGRIGLPWVASLYYSGYTAATLGLGDVVADLPALRLLTVVEAFSGFALVTASLSYVLAVYREQGVLTSLALNLSIHLPDGADSVPRSADAHHLHAWERWMEDTASTLLHVSQAHSQYPILHYFRPANATSSLPVQIGALVRLRRRLGEAVPAAGSSVLASYPGWRALRHATEAYLHEVDAYFIPDGVEVEEPDDKDEAERAYARLLRYMAYD